MTHNQKAVFTDTSKEKPFRDDRSDRQLFPSDRKLPRMSLCPPVSTTTNPEPLPPHYSHGAAASAAAFPPPEPLSEAGFTYARRNPDAPTDILTQEFFCLAVNPCGRIYFGDNHNPVSKIDDLLSSWCPFCGCLCDIVSPRRSHGLGLIYHLEPHQRYDPDLATVPPSYYHRDTSGNWDPYLEFRQDDDFVSISVVSSPDPLVPTTGPQFSSDPAGDGPPPSGIAGPAAAAAAAPGPITRAAVAEARNDLSPNPADPFIRTDEVGNKPMMTVPPPPGLPLALRYVLIREYIGRKWVDFPSGNNWGTHQLAVWPLRTIVTDVTEGCYVLCHIPVGAMISGSPVAPREPFWAHGPLLDHLLTSALMMNQETIESATHQLQLVGRQFCHMRYRYQFGELMRQLAFCATAAYLYSRYVRLHAKWMNAAYADAAGYTPSLTMLERLSCWVSSALTPSFVVPATSQPTAQIGDLPTRADCTNAHPGSLAPSRGYIALVQPQTFMQRLSMGLFGTYSSTPPVVSNLDTPPSGGRPCFGLPGSPHPQVPLTIGQSRTIKRMAIVMTQLRARFVPVPRDVARPFANNRKDQHLASEFSLESRADQLDYMIRANARLFEDRAGPIIGEVNSWLAAHPSTTTSTRHNATGARAAAAAGAGVKATIAVGPTDAMRPFTDVDPDADEPLESKYDSGEPLEVKEEAMPELEEEVVTDYDDDERQFAQPYFRPAISDHPYPFPDARGVSIAPPDVPFLGLEGGEGRCKNGHHGCYDWIRPPSFPCWVASKPGVYHWLAASGSARRLKIKNTHLVHRGYNRAAIIRPLAKQRYMFFIELDGVLVAVNHDTTPSTVCPAIGELFFEASEGKMEPVNPACANIPFMDLGDIPPLRIHAMVGGGKPQYDGRHPTPSKLSRLVPSGRLVPVPGVRPMHNELIRRALDGADRVRTSMQLIAGPAGGMRAFNYNPPIGPKAAFSRDKEPTYIVGDLSDLVELDARRADVASKLLTPPPITLTAPKVAGQMHPAPFVIGRLHPTIAYNLVAPNLGSNRLGILSNISCDLVSLGWAVALPRTEWCSPDGVDLKAPPGTFIQFHKKAFDRAINPGALFWGGVAMAAMLPHTFANTPTNHYVALVKRHLGDATVLLDPFIAQEWQLCRDRIGPGLLACIGPVVVGSLREYADSQKAGPRQDHYSNLLNPKPLAFDHYHRDFFLKSEINIPREGGGWFGKPRGISAVAHTEVQAELGPITAAITLGLKEPTRAYLAGEAPMPRYMTTSGLDPVQQGSIIHQLEEDGFTTFGDDFKEFDSTQGAGTTDTLVWLACSIIHSLPEAAIRRILNRRTTRGRSRFTKFGHVEEMRSGEDFTFLLNTILNLLCHGLALQRLTDDKIIDPCWHALGLGDDSVMAVKPAVGNFMQTADFRARISATVEATSKGLGFKSSIDWSRPLKYCSGFFVPIRVDGRPSRVLCPDIRRVLCKQGFTTSRRDINDVWRDNRQSFLALRQFSVLPLAEWVYRAYLRFGDQYQVAVATPDWKANYFSKEVRLERDTFTTLEYCDAIGLSERECDELGQFLLGVYSLGPGAYLVQHPLLTQCSESWLGAPPPPRPAPYVCPGDSSSPKQAAKEIANLRGQLLAMSHESPKQNLHTQSQCQNIPRNPVKGAQAGPNLPKPLPSESASRPAQNRARAPASNAAPSAWGASPASLMQRISSSTPSPACGGAPVGCSTSRTAHHPKAQSALSPPLSRPSRPISNKLRPNAQCATKPSDSMASCSRAHNSSARANSPSTAPAPTRRVPPPPPPSQAKPFTKRSTSAPALPTLPPVSQSIHGISVVKSRFELLSTNDIDSTPCDYVTFLRVELPHREAPLSGTTKTSPLDSPPSGPASSPSPESPISSPTSCSPSMLPNRQSSSHTMGTSCTTSGKMPGRRTPTPIRAAIRGATPKTGRSSKASLSSQTTSPPLSQLPSKLATSTSTTKLNFTTPSQPRMSSHKQSRSASSCAKLSSTPEIAVPKTPPRSKNDPECPMIKSASNCSSASSPPEHPIFARGFRLIDPLSPQPNTLTPPVPWRHPQPPSPPLPPLTLPGQCQAAQVDQEPAPSRESGLD